MGYRVEGVDGTVVKAETEPGWSTLLAMSTEDLIEHFLSSRRALVSLVRDCTPQQLRRSAIHPQFGAMDVSQWLEFFLLHEAHHLYVIATLTRA